MITNDRLLIRKRKQRWLIQYLDYEGHVWIMFATHEIDSWHGNNCWRKSTWKTLMRHGRKLHSSISYMNFMSKKRGKQLVSLFISIQDKGDKYLKYCWFVLYWVAVISGDFVTRFDSWQWGILLPHFLAVKRGRGDIKPLYPPSLHLPSSTLVLYYLNHPVQTKLYAIEQEFIDFLSILSFFISFSDLLLSHTQNPNASANTKCKLFSNKLRKTNE